MLARRFFRAGLRAVCFWPVVIDLVNKMIDFDSSGAFFSLFHVDKSGFSC